LIIDSHILVSLDLLVVNILTRAVKFLLMGLCLLYVATALYIQHTGNRAIAAGFAEQVPPKQTTPQSAAPPAPEPKVRELWWSTMRGFNFRKGTASDELKSFDGARVKIPGFMVPLEDDAEKVREFLLVPYMGACIHTPPPPPNQIVLVRMAQGKSAAMDWYSPVWVEGVFRISKAGSMYGDAAYTLAGLSTSKYERESNR
jgi:hypothetical protein